MDATISVLGAGFVLGLKHALDGDHLAAMSTLISRKKGLLAPPIIGSIWGLGHTTSLFVAGLLVVLLDVSIPDRLALAMEFAVALMLIGLGLNLLRKIFFGGKLHAHEHAHGERGHSHPHIHGTEEANVDSHHETLFDRRPFIIGLVHGMAGSAALMLLVLSTISDRSVALLYIGIFGLGSVGGMLIMSTVMSLPFLLMASRFNKATSVLQGVAATASIAFGFMLAYEIGVVESLII